MPGRRTVLAGAAATAVAGAAGWWLWPRAEAGPPAEVVEWEQLIPPDLAPDEVVRGIVPHGGIVRATALGGTDADEILAMLVTDWDGKRIRMPGYTLPLDFSGAATREFLLVPYVGACIHVPPPPPNQIVYVTSVTPVQLGNLFDPVWVTGIMRAKALSVEIADVGYHLEAESVTPYG